MCVYVCNISIYLQYQFANFSNPNYKDTGKGSLKLQLINQRSDFSFALFSGGVSNVGTPFIEFTPLLFIKLILLYSIKL